MSAVEDLVNERFHVVAEDEDGCTVTVYEWEDSETIEIQERDADGEHFGRVVLDTAEEIAALRATLEEIADDSEDDDS